MAHTAIWAVMVASIVAVPWAGWYRHYRWGFGLSLFILGECLVLGLNHGRCPLTDVAARYTDDRTDNFDIYLPLWLARNNKRIFGFLFIVGELVFLALWTRRFGL